MHYKLVISGVFILPVHSAKSPERMSWTVWLYIEPTDEQEESLSFGSYYQQQGCGFEFTGQIFRVYLFCGKDYSQSGKR